jgi:hypothetical protein
MDITLNSHEARVLGVLVEKAFTTPDQYPLSINGATNGSNQKSNRDPQVDFSEPEVRIALQGLRMKGLAGLSVASGSRVEKWRHSAKETFKLEDRELAVLVELLLRGPQTAGELRGHAKRMRDIPTIEALDECLATLHERGFVRTVTGGRVPKTAQTLCAVLHPDGASAEATAHAHTREPAPASAGNPAGSPTAPLGAPPAAPPTGPIADRVTTLEARIEELDAKVEHLMQELGG